MAPLPHAFSGASLTLSVAPPTVVPSLPAFRFFPPSRSLLPPCSPCRPFWPGPPSRSGRCLQFAHRRAARPPMYPSSSGSIPRAATRLSTEATSRPPLASTSVRLAAPPSCNLAAHPCPAISSRRPAVPPSGPTPCSASLLCLSPLPSRQLGVLLTSHPGADSRAAPRLLCLPPSTHVRLIRAAAPPVPPDLHLCIYGSYLSTPSGPLLTAL